MTIGMQSFLVYILVFCRMGGMIFFNPLLTRQNILARFRVALVVALTIVIAPQLLDTGPESLTDLGLVFSMAKELIVGMVCGYIFQIYYYLLIFAGDIMDIEFGLSMAKVFDPGTNIQMSISGKLLEILFVLYFFITDCHLVMIRIFTSSYEIIPINGVVLSQGAASAMIQLFISVFSLAIRLILPFIAAEFVLEVVMGVLMKLIPQINVFVMNLQFKILLGLVLLFLFASPITNFIDNYMNMMLHGMEEALYLLQG